MSLQARKRYTVSIFPSLTQYLPRKRKKCRGGGLDAYMEGAGRIFRVAILAQRKLLVSMRYEFVFVESEKMYPTRGQGP